MVDFTTSPTILNYAGVTFMYNGARVHRLNRFQIDDERFASIRSIKEHLELVKIKATSLTRAWLNAEMLFWGYIKPGTPNTMKMKDMATVLQTKVASIC
jgi:hypothetical protein